MITLTVWSGGRFRGSLGGQVPPSPDPGFFAYLAPALRGRGAKTGRAGDIAELHATNDGLSLIFKIDRQALIGEHDAPDGATRCNEDPEQRHGGQRPRAVSEVPRCTA